MPPVTSFPPPKDVFDDDDDDDGWLDMPIIREDTSASGLDEEDQKKYHYQVSAKGSTAGAANATGSFIDVDEEGHRWRAKLERDESQYTRLRGTEEEDADEVHLRTRYLFDEDKAMTPLSQMQATKNLLTEAQRIAYVGLCALTYREMVHTLRVVQRKELKSAIANMELWALKIMGRLYYHMELETQEQKMIESLAEHGVLPEDLVPALMTTHTVANPEYDPEEARRKEEEDDFRAPDTIDDEEDEKSISGLTLVEPFDGNKTPTASTYPDAIETATFDKTSFNDPADPVPIISTSLRKVTTADPHSEKNNPDEEVASQPTETDPESDTKTLNDGPTASTSLKQVQTTTKVLRETSTTIAGVSTTLSNTDKNVTLDIRWTVLCDLFLILIADSVYDARSRVLLEQVALKLGLGWLDLVKFESRVTQALEIQEDIETLEQTHLVESARKAGNKRRYMMLGLATVGGGLVIGLSAGLLAPVIGLGLAGALTTIGVTGTGAFLGGTAGAAVITTGGVLTGSSIAVKGMVKRTQQVRTFDILPLHNNKRVSCILTVPGFMNGINDDVRLPFSVLDPIVGDVFSVLWEPEMIRETGAALRILTGEVLSQIGMTVLQATVMTGLMSALQWPIILTKLGYLIDNPWSNALDRAKAAGRVLAGVLIDRHLGVRPITLIGFSLGARVIFYALTELAKQKQFGIVQDVFLLGATLTVSQSLWLETRSVVSGRYVNAYARNDWVLNYLFRATSGGVGTVAGLRPVENVPGLENVDVTDKIAGHMSYRTFMPLILDQLGFPVFSDFFDEPEEPDFVEERIVVREGEEKKGGWFSRNKTNTTPQKYVSRPPSTATFAGIPGKKKEAGVNGTGTGGVSESVSAPVTPAVGGAEAGVVGGDDDDDLPPRMDHAQAHSHSSPHTSTATLPGSGRNTPTPSRPSTPSNSNPNSHSRSHTHSDSPDPKPDAADPISTPHIPKHAGFDLSAIKDAIREVETQKAKGGGKGGVSASFNLNLGSSSTPTAVVAGPSSSSTPSTPQTQTQLKEQQQRQQKKGFFSRLVPPPSLAPTRSKSTPPTDVVEGNGHQRSSSLDFSSGSTSASGSGVGSGYANDWGASAGDDRGPKTANVLSPTDNAWSSAGPSTASHPHPPFGRSFSAVPKLETDNGDDDDPYSTAASGPASSRYGMSGFRNSDDDFGTYAAGQSQSAGGSGIGGYPSTSLSTSRFASNPLNLPDEVIPSWGALASSTPDLSLNSASANLASASAGLASASSGLSTASSISGAAGLVTTSAQLGAASTASSAASSAVSNGAEVLGNGAEALSRFDYASPSTAKPYVTSFASSFSNPSSSSSSPNPASSFANSFSNSFSTSSFSSALASPPTNAFANPFASPGHDRTPVLSFGALGGGISTSTGAGGLESDGWDVPPLKSAPTPARKATALDGVGANPWS